MRQDLDSGGIRRLRILRAVRPGLLQSCSSATVTCSFSNSPMCFLGDLVFSVVLQLTLAGVAIVGAEGGVDGLSLVVPVVESPPGISFFFLDVIRRY